MDAQTGTSVANVLHFKHLDPTSPAFEAFHPYTSIPTLIDLEIMSNIIERMAKNMQGSSGTGGIDEKSWQDWTLHYGPFSRHFQEATATLGR